MLVGLYLLAGLLTRIAAIVACALMVLFLIAQAQAWARGLSLDCGCFGTLTHERVGLWTIAARRRPRPSLARHGSPPRPAPLARPQALRTAGSLRLSSHRIDAKGGTRIVIVETRQQEDDDRPDAAALETAAEEAREDVALEQQATPYAALYAHWERNQWSALQIDLSRDAATFAAMNRSDQDGFVWLFANRFHAEFNVARLLAPFLLAAPNWASPRRPDSRCRTMQDWA